MIICIKTLSYDTKPKDGSNTFEYVVRLLKQEIEPVSTAQACILVPKNTKILHSTHVRVTETLEKNTDNTYVGYKELREIPFDLNKFTSEEEFDSKGSDSVRKAFKQAFISDELMKKRSEIWGEIKSILDLCSKDTNTILISHSFRLKLIEGYVRSNGNIVTHPELIHQYMSDTKKTYSFGQLIEI